MARRAQAMTGARRGRLLLYLDDPLQAPRGTRRVRCLMRACTFGFWTALGVSIAWHKVERRTGAWIGVELAARVHDRYVEVVNPEKKVKELKGATEELLAKTMVTVRA